MRMHCMLYRGRACESDGIGQHGAQSRATGGDEADDVAAVVREALGQLDLKVDSVAPRRPRN